MRPPEHGLECWRNPVGLRGYTENHGTRFSDSLAVSRPSRSVPDACARYGGGSASGFFQRRPGKRAKS